jgi:hypothetical protein
MSLSNITSLSSIYVPIRLPPATLPGFLSAVDRSSLWHTSALVAAAIETSTLPTRLHGVVAGSSRVSSLGDLAAFLNAGGGQKIAMLSMSVCRGDDNSSVDAHERDDKPQSDSSLATKFDSVNCTLESDSRSRSGKEAYVFAEANVWRGIEADEEEEGKRSPTRCHVSRWGTLSLSRFGWVTFTSRGKGFRCPETHGRSLIMPCWAGISWRS